MENNDFDVFEIIKILIKKKLLFLSLSLLLFCVSLAYLASAPTFHRANFILSSSVLSQNEIILKINELIYLLDNKSYSVVANRLNIKKNDATSIEYLKVQTVKNSDNFVEINFSSTRDELVNEFNIKLEKFFESDAIFSQKEELLKRQLEYKLSKYTQEIDSLKSLKNINGILFQNINNDVISLVESKSKVEEKLAFYKLLNINEGFSVVHTQSSLLVNILSSLIFAFSVALILTLSFHFGVKIKAKVLN